VRPDRTPTHPPRPPQKLSRITAGDARTCRHSVPGRQSSNRAPPFAARSANRTVRASPAWWRVNGAQAPVRPKGRSPDRRGIAAIKALGRSLSSASARAIPVERTRGNRGRGFPLGAINTHLARVRQAKVRASRLCPPSSVAHGRARGSTTLVRRQKHRRRRGMPQCRFLRQAWLFGRPTRRNHAFPALPKCGCKVRGGRHAKPPVRRSRQRCLPPAVRSAPSTLQNPRVERLEPCFCQRCLLKPSGGRPRRAFLRGLAFIGLGSFAVPRSPLTFWENISNNNPLNSFLEN